MAIEYTFYNIYCLDDSFKDLYVGSTTSFNDRVNCHRSRSKREGQECCDNKLYKAIRNNGTWDTWKIEILEKRLCDDARDAWHIELEYILELNATLNSKYSFRTLEELNQYRLEYRQRNADILKHNLIEWRNNNKEHIAEYKKRYNAENKQKIAEQAARSRAKRNVKVTCECGSTYSICHKSDHTKTKKHQLYISNLDHNL